MEEKEKNKKLVKNKYFVAFIILFVLIIVGLLFYFLVSGRFLGPLTGRKSNDITLSDGFRKFQQTGVDEVIKPQFDYVVKEIKQDLIVIEGKNGDMYISKDPSITSVYAGLSKESPMMPIDNLKVGDRVKVEAIPGKKVWIFVYQM